MIKASHGLLGALLCLAIFSSSCAYPEFRDRIPNGYGVLNGTWQGVGHMVPQGGGVRNPFGTDFQKHGYKWTVELCQLDSDGDHLTNGQELGDPDCIWIPGATPSRTVNITHPGFAEGHLPKPVVDTCANVPPAKDEVIVNMTFSNFAIPSKLTTYACQRFDMPKIVNDRPNHIVRFDPIIDREDIVHHLIVFSCLSVPPTTEPWECGLEMPSGCKEFVWGWALGGKEECVPEDAGIPVGANGPKFFVIQMHYNNAKHVPDARDKSGVSMHITPHLRKYDASVLLSGAAENDIVIPPKQKAFQVVSYCPAYCTEAAFPESGIKVYAFLLHMHLLGASMRTDIIYANGTRATLGEVPHYDFNSQSWVAISPPTTLYRGDALMTYCTYDSSGQNTTTLGGASTTEEMCTSNLAYYPRVKGLDLCTNFTDDDHVKMGRCAGFDFFWDTGKKLPICDAEDVPPQASLIAGSVLSQCKGGQQCSGLCRQAILTWIRNSPCVERNGLRTTLNYCGPYEADCKAFADLFNSKCMHMCYSDEKSGETSCGTGRKCVSYSCSDASNNRIIAIAAAITIVVTIAIIGSAVLAIAKCGRFKRKVEYVG